ncbi:MAG: 6,7-dimethyl-8-ribityllumazine synthase [Nitrospirae bacterium]|nr:6,7-dimethyl-8-ribityllumazine synthase [Nitrospirota bacterium]
MATVLEGDLTAQGLKFAVVVGRFNKAITQNLLDGALEGLRRHGVTEDHITVAWVPGSFEVPVVARRFAKARKVDAVICLGVVIRGGTPHFDYVAGEAASGVARAGQDLDVPVIFGIVTADTIEQAIERSGTKMGNKGWDAALAAIEMVNLLRKI